MERLKLIRTEEVPDEIFDFARMHYERRFSGILGVEASEAKISLGEKGFRSGSKGRQYLADDILREGGERANSGIVIIITSVDIYTHGTNYIFGLATLGVGLISSARIDPKFWDFVPEIKYYAGMGEKFFLIQFGKVLLHELGHALSLGHCQEPRCVMRYSNSPLDLYSKGEDYCAMCWDRLTKSLEK
ncbi:MAG: hypothetical protein N3D12_04205 [Candidatus Methanomethyliaceae archaeon]|nr:hypothetical protein [Candidatus Methanomethyliaceae archaeon]